MTDRRTRASASEQKADLKGDACTVNGTEQRSEPDRGPVRIRPLRFEAVADAERELLRVGVDPEALRILAPKAIGTALRVDGVLPPAASILKQEMLALGGEAAVSRGVVENLTPATDVILLGTLKHFERLLQRLERQPYGLKQVGRGISQVLASLQRFPETIEFPKRTFALRERTLLVGIVNVTPDSFSDGGECSSVKSAVERALGLAESGADLIDIGGESTRPGAEVVDASEEVRRVAPVIAEVSRRCDVPLLIDTRKGVVARTAIEAGAQAINDVSAGRYDPDLLRAAADAGVPLVLMHSRGEPADMADRAVYGDLIGEIVSELAEAMEGAVRAGVSEERIIVDPGIGFAKTAEQSLEVIRRLEELRGLGRPIMIGASRKSFIGAAAGGNVREREAGSIAAAVLAVSRGANLVRVHHVAAHLQAVAIADAVFRRRA